MNFKNWFHINILNCSKNYKTTYVCTTLLRAFWRCQNWSKGFHCLRGLHPCHIQTNKHLSWYTNPQIVPKSTTFYPMSFVQRTLVTFISRSNYIIFISGISNAWSNSMWWPNQRGPSQKEKNWALHAPVTHYTNHTTGVPMFDVLIWVYLYFML